MSSTDPDAVPPPLRHSVFLSYATADRPAARALRDTLDAAGLDVWLDEDELAGGEAWDAKIRHQIRTCTYFMPLISRTTETRREGYFRREWRQAVERTQDLADDVLFLVPIVIDDTRDYGARVPEKFFTVQWLRVPGGQPTPALRELAGRLAAGDSVAVPPSPMAPLRAPTTPPTPAAPPAQQKDKRGRVVEPPPPFPAVPPFPEGGRVGRFLYELLIWCGRMIYALWLRLPRWLRMLATVLIVINAINGVFRRHQPVDEDDPQSAKVPTASASKPVEPPAVPSTEKTNGTEAALKSLVGAAAHAFQMGRPLALVNFDGNDEVAANYASKVFEQAMGALEKASSKEAVSFSPIPLETNFTDDAALARGTALESQFVLTGSAFHHGDRHVTLAVKLYAVKSRTVVWSDKYESTDSDPTEAALQITLAVTTSMRPVPAAP